MYFAGIGSDCKVINPFLFMCVNKDGNYCRKYATFENYLLRMD